MFFKTGGVVFYFCTNTRATRGKTNSLRTNQSVWTEKLKPASFYLSNSPIVVLMNTCCPFSLVCGFIVVISQIKCGNMCSSITLHILCAVLKSSLCRRHWILFFLFFALFFFKACVLYANEGGICQNVLSIWIFETESQMTNWINNGQWYVVPVPFLSWWCCLHTFMWLLMCLPEISCQRRKWMLVSSHFLFNLITAF